MGNDIEYKIQELDIVYPDRKHYSHDTGLRFKWRKNYNTTYYSGIGCVYYCDKCKKYSFYPPLPKGYKMKCRRKRHEK